MCLCACEQLQEHATAKAEADAASGDLPPALDEDTDKYVLPTSNLNSDPHLIRRVSHAAPPPTSHVSHPRPMGRECVIGACMCASAEEEEIQNLVFAHEYLLIVCLTVLMVVCVSWWVVAGGCGGARGQEQVDSHHSPCAKPHGAVFRRGCRDDLNPRGNSIFVLCVFFIHIYHTPSSSTVNTLFCALLLVCCTPCSMLQLPVHTLLTTWTDPESPLFRGRPIYYEKGGVTPLDSGAKIIGSVTVRFG